MDVSNLTFKKKQWLAGTAILFAWTQLILTSARAYLGVPSLSGWFLGTNSALVHDVLLAVLYFVLVPTALVSSFLWIAGFVQLHAGEKQSSSAKSGSASPASTGRGRRAKAA